VPGAAINNGHTRQPRTKGADHHNQPRGPLQPNHMLTTHALSASAQHFVHAHVPSSHNRHSSVRLLPVAVPPSHHTRAPMPSHPIPQISPRVPNHNPPWAAPRPVATATGLANAPMQPLCSEPNWPVSDPPACSPAHPPSHPLAHDTSQGLARPLARPRPHAPACNLHAPTAPYTHRSTSLPSTNLRHPPARPQPRPVAHELILTRTDT
jgi:hypothetical protein